MKKVLEKFSEKLKINKQINSHNIFERYYPTKKDNTLILQLVSLSEKSAIDEIKDEFLKYIRSELNNDYITLKIAINQEAENKNMLYTNERKIQTHCRYKQRYSTIKRQIRLKYNIIL